ncbi:DNA-binding protein [Pseudomonas sp. FW300-N1A1]|uniref:alpha-xenorhabdolysin family binary toxin subunit A n=1 Tax=Pseudomonas sp. FW300-N1A1 TaxID=2075555 RepID=UPI000CD2D606|nr:alpha-xenorhabdolysin family binary toxin subunit A [Pseudomonas sp. FW300-N1A1]POA20830.1 DNA-binding protein [Pseudomonas sp. FW300-N1A1]
METQLWEASLKDKTAEEVAGLAAVVPKTMVSLSSGSSNDIVRPAGLLLTKKQIIDLRKYEAAGLALPQHITDVNRYLNFGALDSGGDGFRPEDFLATFKKVYNHARKWQPLRARIMLTGTHLRLFGLNMAVYSRTVEEIYSDVRAANRLETHNITTYEQLREWELKEGHGFPGLVLDAEIVSDLGDALDLVSTQVREYLEDVIGIKEGLDDFSIELRERIAPEIKLLTAFISHNTYAADVGELNKEIERRTASIDELNAQYKALVNQSLTAVSSFSLVGLGVAIYHGVEAENVRAERNNLSDVQNEAIKRLASKNKTLGSLQRVRSDMQNLTIVAVEADVATKNLIHVWNVLHDYTSQSATAITKMEDAVKLRQFMTQFRLVAAPWTEIHQNADALVALFKEADEEFKAEYGIQGMNRMRTLLQTEKYPELKTDTLRSCSALLGDEAVKAKMYFLKSNYLPAVNSTFERMLGEANGSFRDLAELSLTTKLDLKSRIAQLVALNQELADGSDEVEDIRGEQVELLAQAHETALSMSIRLGNRLIAISEPFDQRLTTGFMETLNTDLTDHAAALARLEGRLVEPEKKLKVISEAVDELNKIGLSEAFKSVELTFDKVKELGATPTQVQLVMAAVEKLKRDLEGAAKGISFVLMIKESHALRTLVEEVHNEIVVEKRKWRTLNDKVELIKAFHAMDDQRKLYVVEYAVATGAVNQFLTAVTGHKSSGLQEQVAGFIQEAGTFVRFLEPVTYL